jgi:hypothetical protein
MATTYPFEHLRALCLKNPVLDPPFQLTDRNIGTGKVSILMLTQPGGHHRAADGVVMTSYIAGSNAEVIIEVPLTSDLHRALLELYKQLNDGANGPDLGNWAQTVITLTFLDGSECILSGVCFNNRGAKGGTATWDLRAAEVKWR